LSRWADAFRSPLNLTPFGFAQGRSVFGEG
jgi:hypothetical protein